MPGSDTAQERDCQCKLLAPPLRDAIGRKELPCKSAWTTEQPGLKLVRLWSGQFPSRTALPARAASAAHTPAAWPVAIARPSPAVPGLVQARARPRRSCLAGQARAPARPAHSARRRAAGHGRRRDAASRDRASSGRGRGHSVASRWARQGSHWHVGSWVRRSRSAHSR
jgi:hypothetical protein